MVSEHKMQEKDESEDASEKYISDDDESMTIKEPRIS